MEIQIFKNKETGKIEGWASGTVYVSSKNCKTLFKDISDNDFNLLKKGKHEIEMDSKENFSLKEIPLTEKELEQKQLKEKVKNGTATLEEMRKLLADLL